MTFVESLFGLIPAASTGQQWTARSMQLVNWGGYAGYHAVPFHPDGTLISGGSGTGKSTLLDAYIALMMPHTTPFNGASNGATAGRARGKDQRNIISYVRGKVDDRLEQGGQTVKETVLRGEKSDTWSALAMTWSDQSGTVFTALRIFYVPRGAAKNEECTFFRATYEGAFDLTRLEEFAVGRFPRGILTSALGLTLYDTDTAFATRLHSVLGIGASGDGHKAMALLARIQAGQQITTVDALYKQMVLEEPKTFAVAAAAIAHFDELAAIRAEMQTAAAQVELLAPIVGLHRTRQESLDQANFITAIGAQHAVDTPSPFTLWRANQVIDLVDAAVATNREAHGVAKQASVAAAAQLQVDENTLAQIQERQRSSGGDQIDGLNRDIRALENELAKISATRAAYDRLAGQVGQEVTGKQDFDRLAKESARFVAQDGAAQEQFRVTQYEAMKAKDELASKIDQNRLEIHSLRNRKGNIPADLHAARCEFARALGLAEDDLPFVGELVEVRAEYENWRGAIGQALGGFATTLLVDEQDLSRVRTAINSLTTARRIRFEGVPTDVAFREPTERHTLPGRLDYKRGRFTGWLVQRLEESFDFVCVAGPEELGQHARALTVTGQVRQGQRGQHGGQGQASVLGFSNESKIAELVDLATALQEDALAAERLVDAITTQVQQHRQDYLVHQQLLAMTWDQIDTASVAAKVNQRHEQLTDLIAGNDVLSALKAEEKQLVQAIDQTRTKRSAALAKMDRLEQEFAQLADLEDQAKDTAADCAERGITVTAAQVSHLDNLLGQSNVKGALSALEAGMQAVAKDLSHGLELANRTAEGAAAELTQIFDRFRATWPNPNLGIDPDTSYPDFKRILDELEHQGLFAIREKWNKNVTKLSGQELTRLGAEMNQAVDEIRQRMEPVNDILIQLPFQDSQHRLQITATLTQSPDITQFRKELRALAQESGKSGTPVEQEERFLAMERLLNRIRVTSPEYRRLIDVREHVRVSAQAVDLEGNHVSVYDHIAGKSGGESQELVAFIVGAALRYQLGDADAAHPRYAPVFLDEAFIKADHRFAGRSVAAWQGLGFQLIIGSPLDKVSALEPHLALLIQTVKDSRGHTNLTWALAADAAELKALPGA